MDSLYVCSISSRDTIERIKLLGWLSIGLHTIGTELFDQFAEFIET